MFECTREEETAYLALYEAVVKDLCNEELGGYQPASDNDEDEEYNELYCPSDPELPAVYILRRNATTLVVSALDYELRDIEIRALDDWEPHRQRLTPEKGVQFEVVPAEEAKRLAEEWRARNE